MLTLLTTPMREIRRSVRKAVEMHNIIIVTVKTLGPRFCIESATAVAMLDLRRSHSVCNGSEAVRAVGSGRIEGGAAGCSGHSECVPPPPSGNHHPFQCQLLKMTMRQSQEAVSAVEERGG